jgi:hypothetical protein
MENHGEVIHLELKYCERCGGLWLRPQGSLVPYCAPCATEMACLPFPRKRRTRARLPVLRPAAEGARPALQIIYGKGGRV